MPLALSRDLVKPIEPREEQPLARSIEAVEIEPRNGLRAEHSSGSSCDRYPPRGG